MSKQLPTGICCHTSICGTPFLLAGFNKDYPASYNLNFDPNEVSQCCKVERQEEVAVVERKVGEEVLEFFEGLGSRQRQITPDIAEILNDNFWDL